MIRSRRLAQVILAASTAVTCDRAAAQRPTASPLVIRNVRLVDVRTGVVQEGSNVVLRGDTIVEVTRDRLDIGGAQVLDGSGRYLIPGLIDTHVHLFQPWTFNWPDTLAQFGWILASGVTTVRDAGAGGREASYVASRKAIDAGRLTGPRIVIAGHVWAVMRAGEARDTVEAMRAFARLGLHQVKHVGSVPRTAALESIRAARANGLSVFGHTAEFFGGNMADEYALEAIDAGISGLSHATGKYAGGRKLDLGLRGWFSPDTVWINQLIKSAVARGVWLEPTLTVTYAGNNLVYGQCTAGFDVDRVQQYFPYHPAPRRLPGAAAADSARVICANQWKFVREFHQAGGMIIAGSDFVPFAPLGVVEEIRLLVAAGLSPLAALQAATVNAAKALELSD